MKCGCGGEIKQGVGCLSYNGSEEHDDDIQHERMMRHGGFGFGEHSEPDESMMSAHLQANGLSFETTEEILLGQPV